MTRQNFLYTAYVRARKAKSLSQLIILCSFLITFASIRALTHLQKAGIIPNQSGILHIHHMVPGIILLLLSGYFGIAYWHNKKIHLSMSLLFGIGAALTVDEFALWLFLRDVYWAKQGRDSIDAIIIVVIFLALSFTLSEIYNHYHIKKIYKLLKK